MRSAVRPAAGVGLLALALYLYTAAPGITWRNGGIDSGELATAVATGSVAHPPGYPTYLLLGRLAALLPVEPARSLAWLSALSAALTCGCTALAASAGPKREQGRVQGAAYAAGGSGAERAQRARTPKSELGGPGERSVPRLGERGSAPALLDQLITLSPALWLITSPLLWSSATYAEVNAPAAAVTAFWLGVQGWTPRPARHLLGVGALLGLALGIHALLVILAAGTMLGQLIPPRAGSRLASLGALAAGLIAGAALAFGSLALFPATGPVNWYAPQTPEGWLLLVTADAYRGLLSPATAPIGLLAMLRALVENLGFVGAIAAVVGLQEVLARPGRRLADGTLLCASLSLIYVLFAAAYAARDSEVYLLPALVLLTPAAVTGLRTAAVALVATFSHDRTTATMTSAALAGLVLLPALANGAIHGANLNLREDRAASLYSERALGAAPRDAVLVTSGDAATFALWYARYALGTRPDVAILNQDLLHREWYRQHLVVLHPDLALPSAEGAADDSVDLLTRVNPRRPIVAVPPLAPETAARAGA